MKLTIKNYKEAVKNIDFKKLPNVAQETHKQFSDFAEFYNDDKDIKEMLDNHFNIVEPYLKTSNSKSKKWQVVFTNAGGKIVASNKSDIDAKTKDYKTIAHIHSSSGKVNWIIPKKDVPDNALMKIKNYAKGIASKKSNNYPIEDERKSKVSASQATSKKATTKRTTSKKSSSPRKAQRKPIEVDLMPLEIKIIKRYLNFHENRVTERQVSLLYKVIQKAATEKTIRKTSKYASEIKSISNDLIKTYKEMDGSCKFEIPTSLYKKLKNIVDDYGVTPAVALIKRFINLYGNITKAKAQRLLSTVTNSLKNGKVKKSDKEFEQVKKVEKHLHDYLESDKLLVTQVQLKGLQGIAGLGK